MGRMEFAYVITVCDKAEQNCPHLWPGTLKRLSWPLFAPKSAEGDDNAQLEAFRRARGEIFARMDDWLKSIH